jgi:hypothetical protein
VNERELIVVALEQLEVGDQAAAVLTLLEALEGEPAPRRFPCPYCSQRFAWPGLVAAHLDRGCVRAPLREAA